MAEDWYVGVDVTSNFVSLCGKTTSALQNVISVHCTPASMFAFSNRDQVIYIFKLCWTYKLVCSIGNSATRCGTRGLVFV